MELQSRCGTRIGEILKLRVKDIEERKIIVRDPKSGKDVEVIFMPEQVANRLKAYIQNERLGQEDRVFKLCYGTATKLIIRLEARLGI